MRPEGMHIINALYFAANEVNVDLYITSANDGTHSEKSLHYAGQAIDVDVVETITREQVEKVTRFIRQGLTIEYDVLAEWEGEKFSHWHIEFQPKRSHRNR
jgi:hypothetical protein